MINPSELRIANILTKGSGTIYRVEGVIGNSVFSIFSEGMQFPADEFSGVPLTEEWLTKFGFEKRNACGGYHAHPVHHVFIDLDFNAFTFSMDSQIQYITAGESMAIVSVKYVHQLQNWFFSLTGEELTIK